MRSPGPCAERESCAVSSRTEGWCEDGNHRRRVTPGGPDSESYLCIECRAVVCVGCGKWLVTSPLTLCSICGMSDGELDLASEDGPLRFSIVWPPTGFHPPDGIRLSQDTAWVRLEAKQEPPYSITGKYLFFSEDPEALLRAAIAEIGEHGFHHAKISVSPPPRGSEYVLCLYYSGDGRKRELARRNTDHYGVKYRYWKSDEATDAGRYSDRFRADGG